jgi:hypothetical protein
MGTMRRLNLGCGFDVKEGWTNADINPSQKDVEPMDFSIGFPADYYQHFDFILINHVLCTMKSEQAQRVLENAWQMLKPKGQLQVIDMDLLKLFSAYESSNYDLLPIAEGDGNSKLCYAISGYGTRLSHYTPMHLVNCIILATKNHHYEMYILDNSEYDTRPNESCIVEVTK